MSRAEITREPIEVYHANDCVGHSRLEVFRHPDRGPARYHGQYIAKTIPGFQGSTATEFGQALDSLVLEKKRIFKPHPTTYMGKDGNKAAAPLVEKPWNWNANDCKAWREQNKDFVILSPDAGDPDGAPNVDACNFAVQANPIAAALLGAGEAQLSFRYDFGPFRVQVRPDWWNKDGVTLPDGTKLPNYIVDLKSAADADQFERNRRSLGYDRQAALYSELVRMVLADTGGIHLEEVPQIPFFFLVVYKSAPVQAVVTVLDKRDLIDATEQVIGDIRRLKEAYTSGKWPGVPEGIVTLPSLDWRRAKSPDYQPEPAFTVAA
jgi:hypothetical protein